MLINNMISVEIKKSLYINCNKNNVVRPKRWRHLQRFVYSLYCSMRESFMPWAGCSVNAALREGNSLAFQKRKSEFVDDWCNGKGIQSTYFRYDSDISKYKRSFFAWYHAPSMLPAFKFCQMLR